MTHLYDSAWSNNIEHWRTLLNLFQDQIPKSDSFYAKIDYLNLPVRQEFSGTKPIRIEEIEEKIISKLTQNGHPIKDIHMRHFTDKYTLEVMRIRDKEGCQTYPNRPQKWCALYRIPCGALMSLTTDKSTLPMDLYNFLLNLKKKKVYGICYLAKRVWLMAQQHTI